MRNTSFKLRMMFMRKRGCLVKLFCTFAVIIILVILYKRFSGVYAPDESEDTMDFYNLPDDNFGRAKLKDLVDAHPIFSWPMFQGYNDRFATAESNPIDIHLYKRIELSQKRMTLPSYRIKGKQRHEWKFDKIIHQTWRDDFIPADAVKWVKSWRAMNPDWTHLFWTDESQREFIKLHFPMLLAPYDSWTVPVQRADMFRYIALYAFGGVYADLDMEALRPLDEIRNWSSCILSREPDPQVFVIYDPLASWANNWTFTCNAFFACRANHPFLHYLIARTVQNSPLVRFRNECPLGKTILCTGPWMMSFANTFYLRSVPEELRLQKPDIDVITPDFHYFLPTYDSSRAWLVKCNCLWYIFAGSAKQRETCLKELYLGFANKPRINSFTNHHWFSTYHTIVKEFVDIKTLNKTSRWSPNSSEFEMCFGNSCKF